MNFETITLDNGLQLVAECNPQAYSAAFGVFVNAGSRDESAENNGVSHFLEHMAFKGTPTRSAEDVNRELDEMGSHSNARTGEERTIYHATVLPEFQEPVVKLLCDIMRPSLRHDDFEMEKKVIIEEILMYEDQPPFGGHERIMSAFYDGHPLGRSILGTVDTVGDLTPESMRAYFEQRYSPDNMLVAAAGKIDFSALVETVRQATDNWAPSRVARQETQAVTQKGYERLHRPQAAQEYVLQLSDGPSSTDKDRYASRLLGNIVGDDSGSRLFWELVDPGLVEYAGMAPYEYGGTGLMMTVICCEPGTAGENLNRLRNVQQQLLQEGVTNDELERAKRKLISGIVLQSERPENRMFSIGNNWLVHGRYRSTRELVQSYEDVTLAEVNEVVSRFPYNENFTLLVSPIESPAAS